MPESWQEAYYINQETLYFLAIISPSKNGSTLKKQISPVSTHSLLMKKLPDTASPRLKTLSEAEKWINLLSNLSFSFGDDDAMGNFVFWLAVATQIAY